MDETSEAVAAEDEMAHQTANGLEDSLESDVLQENNDQLPGDAVTTQSECEENTANSSIDDFLAGQRASLDKRNRTACMSDEEAPSGYYDDPNDTTEYYDANEYDDRCYDLEQELEYVKEKNNELNQKLRVLGQILSLDSFLPDEMNQPVALVLIPDNPQARYYKEIIEEFLSSLPPIKESRLRREKKADEYKPMYQHSSFNLQSLSRLTNSSSHDDDSYAQNPSTRNKIKMLYNCFVALGDYFVDACGQPLVNFDSTLTDGWVIPSYPQSSNVNSIGDPDKITETKKFQMTCFNCGGPHNLRECTEKRDLVKISQNRLALFEKFGAAPGLAARSTRYHLEVSEVDKRFAKFSPGRITQELREALGLGRRSLPLHVYKMRQLGYPPGWLIEAEMESSGLDLIQDQKNESEDVELVEDGEVVCDEDENGVVISNGSSSNVAGVKEGAKKSNEKADKAADPKQKEVTYNLDKLVAYAGFNEKMPEGVNDECNRMRPAMPPMQKHQQLSAWLRYLSKDIEDASNVNGDRKRPIDIDDTDDEAENLNQSGKRLRGNETINESADMDICEDEPVMPIIQPNDEGGYQRGFIPLPPMSEPPPLPEEDLLIRYPMPSPINITNWWVDALKKFIMDESSTNTGTTSELDRHAKGKKSRRKQNTNIVLNEEGEIVDAHFEDNGEDDGAIPISFDNTNNDLSVILDDDEDDEIETCGAASTVEDTIRTMRYSTVSSLRQNQLERESAMGTGKQDEDQQPTNGSEMDSQNDEKGNTLEAKTASPFKLTEELYEELSHYHNNVEPTDAHLFLFPDKNDSESIEELNVNPPEEALQIQLGEEEFRYKSAKGLPEYWKFSQGIEPYEAKEEVPILGLYSKILNTLKQHNKTFR